MKAYLHLADSGLVLEDLSLRLYDQDGEGVSISGVTMEELPTAGDYVLNGLPDVPQPYNGLTLTFEQPEGVFHSLKFGLAESQPANIIIPIREALADPIDDLSLVVLKDGVEFNDISISQLAIDGEYILSGWDSPSTLNENWSVRWIYNDQVFSVQWIGNLITGPTHYIHILARQSPFEYGKDPLNRVLFSCNYDCRARVNTLSSNFIHEMAKVISDASLGVIGATLFIGPQVEIPSGEGPYIALKQTGGFAPDESHNTRTENLGLQVIVLASDYDQGDTRAKAIYHLLDGKRSFTVAV